MGCVAGLEGSRRRAPSFGDGSMLPRAGCVGARREDGVKRGRWQRPDATRWRTTEPWVTKRQPPRRRRAPGPWPASIAGRQGRGHATSRHTWPAGRALQMKSVALSTAATAWCDQPRYRAKKWQQRHGPRGWQGRLVLGCRQRPGCLCDAWAWPCCRALKDATVMHARRDATSERVDFTYPSSFSSDEPEASGACVVSWQKV